MANKPYTLCLYVQRLLSARRLNTMLKRRGHGKLRGKQFEETSHVHGTFYQLKIFFGQIHLGCYVNIFINPGLFDRGVNFVIINRHGIVNETRPNKNGECWETLQLRLETLFPMILELTLEVYVTSKSKTFNVCFVKFCLHVEEILLDTIKSRYNGLGQNGLWI